MKSRDKSTIGGDSEWIWYALDIKFTCYENPVLFIGKLRNSNRICYFSSVATVEIRNINPQDFFRAATTFFVVSSFLSLISALRDFP